MNLAVPGAPIFGIGQIPDKMKKDVQSIPNIGVTVKRKETDQHIASQKKACPSTGCTCIGTAIESFRYD